jgi:hypothetical protein
MPDPVPPTPQGDPPATPPAQSAPPANPPPNEDWRDRRLAQQTAQMHELRERLAEATARAVATPTSPTPSPTPAPVLDSNSAEFRNAVSAAAKQEAANSEFVRQCNSAYEEGTRAFGESFAGRVTSLRRLMNERDPESVSNFNSFVATALETGSAPKLFHSLGGDLNRAMEILQMPPVKRAVELAKMAQAQEGEVTQEGEGGGEQQMRREAPRPINSIGNRGSAVTQVAPDDPARADNLSSADWFARRQQQIKERGGEPWARR